MRGVRSPLGPSRCRVVLNPIRSLFDPHELFSDPYVAEKNRYGEWSELGSRDIDEGHKPSGMGNSRVNGPSQHDIDGKTREGE
jgi:hypothetical protein